MFATIDSSCYLGFCCASRVLLCHPAAAALPKQTLALAHATLVPRRRAAFQLGKKINVTTCSEECRN